MPSRLHIIGNMFIDVATLLIPIALLVAWFFLDMAIKHIFKRAFKAALKRVQNSRGDEALKHSLQHRINTIRQLSTQLSRAVLAVFMVSMTLGSIGIDIKPVIAGIGVVGLGFSLAAQNIIRDYINGFIILIENQYNVGDWIEVNSFSGTVELFTLRSTRLRDIDGNLVVIPNSTVQTIINYTKDWSVALIKIGITYESDFHKAGEIMEELGKEIADEMNSVILGPPKFQGITDFGENAVYMRIVIKTLPGQQWAVARSFREKLKDRFDAEKISFAYPQVVVHRAEDEPQIS
ncbi:MAG: mechanosensitive ion channel family protein [Synergistaceae bacterium]|nr:mechanosensitive ion channel family protein [Synergistaceae bacterium]